MELLAWEVESEDKEEIAGMRDCGSVVVHRGTHFWFCFRVHLDGAFGIVSIMETISLLFIDIKSAGLGDKAVYYVSCDGISYSVRRQSKSTSVT